MIQTNSIHDAWLGRTAAVEYDNAIQYAGFLVLPEDGAQRKDILPGMVLKDLGNKKLALYDGKGTPFGLAAVFYAPGYGKGGINQLGESDEFTAIVGNTNTTVRIQKAALDPTASFALSEDGTAVPVYANANGQVASASQTNAIIGKLLEVAANGDIVIQLYAPKIDA